MTQWIKHDRIMISPQMHTKLLQHPSFLEASTQ